VRIRFFFKAGEVHASDTLGIGGGYFVIFDSWIAVSSSDTTGHDDLLLKIAMEHHCDTVEVNVSGLRFYYKYSSSGIIISGSREPDNLEFVEHFDKYSILIKNNARFF